MFPPTKPETKPTTMNHFNNVKDSLIDLLGVGPDSITMETRLQEDLGFDSLDTIEMIMEFEDTYQIDIKEDDVLGIQTVRGIVEYLGARTAEKYGWKPFFFESNQFFSTIADMAGWEALRNAYPELSDEDFLNAREATYREHQARPETPNYGFRMEHRGEHRLRDFFAENNMKVEPRH